MKNEVAALALCQLADLAAEAMRDTAQGLRANGRRVFVKAFADAKIRPAMLAGLQHLRTIANQSRAVDRGIDKLMRELVAEHLDPAGWRSWLVNQIERRDREDDPLARLSAHGQKHPANRVQWFFTPAEAEQFLRTKALAQGIDWYDQPESEIEDWTANICCRDRTIWALAFESFARCEPVAMSAWKAYLEGDDENPEFLAIASSSSEFDALTEFVHALDDKFNWIESLADYREWCESIGLAGLLDQMFATGKPESCTVTFAADSEAPAPEAA
jgi:hypothetical protein